jgi:hypothetical protein
MDTTTASRPYMTDKHSKMRFLVDNSADLCVYHRSRVGGPRSKADYELLAANGTTIPTYDYYALHLDFGLQRDFSWSFVGPELDSTEVDSNTGSSRTLFLLSF